MGTETTSNPLRLRERIEAARRDAMAGDNPRRRATLLLLGAAIRDRDAAARARDDQGQAAEAAVRALLATMIEQREASADLYEQGGRLEMAENEREESRIIAEFLPAPLTTAETGAAVTEAITTLGARSLRDLGRVMDHIRALHGERIDLSRAAAKARDILSEGA